MISSFSIISLLILVITSINYTNTNNLSINTKKLINMYKSSKQFVYVYADYGLGNRLMSYAASIILSIYYESKPLCIFSKIFT